MVGRTRYRMPLSVSLERKFSALRARLDVRVLASSADGEAGDGTFRLWRRLPARPPARRRRLLRDAAVSRRRRATAVPSRRRDDAEPVRGLGRARGPRSVTPADGADRRAARRLADVLPPVRLAGAPGARARRGPP